MESQPTRTPEREAYYRKIDASNLAPLWEVLRGLILKEPRSPAQPTMWRYDSVRLIRSEGRGSQPGSPAFV